MITNYTFELKFKINMVKRKKSLYSVYQYSDSRNQFLAINYWEMGRYIIDSYFISII